MVDRKWLKYRIRDEDVSEDGAFRDKTYALSDGSEMPLTKEECMVMIVSRPFCLMLENTYNCATVRFSWEDTKDIIQHGILAYRVDWDWKYIPDHYTKHEDELYYVFLDPEDITIEVLENVLGNKSYRNVDKTQLKQIVSFGKLHVASNGQFRTQPSAIMATVAMAIGIQEMEIAQIVRENSHKPYAETVDVNSIKGILMSQKSKWENEDN